MDTAWISQTSADLMAKQAHAGWMLTDPAGCSRSVDLAKSHFASGRFDWLMSVMHQSPRRGADRIEDQHAYAMLTLHIQRDQLFMKTFPVAAWACPDVDHGKNSELLAGATGLSSCVPPSSTYGHDGFVALSESIDFQGVGLGDSDYRGDVLMRVEQGRQFALEIGSITMSKSVAILTTGGTLARFPYEIPGGEPMLFAFVLKR